MWYVGVDWANDHHDIVVIDEKGRQVGSLRVNHNPEGMSKLNTFLEQIVGTGPKEQVACIIETTHGLLIAHLLEAGWPVYPVNPRNGRPQTSSLWCKDGYHRCLLAGQNRTSGLGRFASLGSRQREDRRTQTAHA